MNNIRRTKLAKLYEELETLKSLLEEVAEEEQEAFGNIPENLQYTERYEKAEEAVDNLDTAVSALEEALESIELAQE